MTSDQPDAGDPQAGASVLFEVADAVAIITLNRPDKLNTVNQAVHDGLDRAFRHIEAAAEAADGTIRAVLLTGAGRGFCAGQDLSDRAAMLASGEPLDLGASLDRTYNRLIRRMHALPLPIVCAVNGVAAGAGAGIALAADIVLAARSASFVQAFARVGLGPDSGVSHVLPRLIGNARARALAMTAAPVSAEQAEAWGMIWRVVEDTVLAEEARALACSLAQAPTRALGFVKQAFEASAANDLDTQLDLERDLQRLAGRTQDYREGVTAFLAKRRAVFQGR